MRRGSLCMCMAGSGDLCAIGGGREAVLDSGEFGNGGEEQTDQCFFITSCSPPFPTVHTPTHCNAVEQTIAKFKAFLNTYIQFFFFLYFFFFGKLIPIIVQNEKKNFLILLYMQFRFGFGVLFLTFEFS